MGTLEHGRAVHRAVMALLITGLLVLAGCGGGGDTSADTTTTAKATTTTDKTERTTMAIPFDTDGAAKNLNTFVMSTCYGALYNGQTSEKQAIGLYNYIVEFVQDKGATDEQLEAFDALVTPLLVKHCGPELAGEIDEFRLALDD